MRSERFARVRLLGALILGIGAASCSDAKGTATGGAPLFDAAIGETTEPSDASSCGDPTRDAGSGHAWADLYRDYFGPEGQASCSGTGACHASATDKGAVNSDFVCGADAEACYAGITSPQAGLVFAGDKTTDPKSTTLYAVLRKKCGGGSMPDEPKFAFDTADMQRIVDWMRAGSPKN